MVTREIELERLETAHTSRSICPIERYLSIFRDHWSLLIMRELLDHPRRFSELKKSLISVTSKTLSERLAELVEAEVILRTAYPDVPVRVVYSLTEKGQDFDRILEAVRFWGEKWMPLEKAL